jgi:glycosyltransferase involved in cell wall biosynthesis
VLVGGEPFREEERRFLAGALGSGERTLHIAAASDALLRRLYEQAAALVVTSRCEGFGLPVLEAMARGCAVACTEGGALAEVAGGHAAMFSPDSADACAQAIREAVEASAARLRSAQLHAHEYSWARTAQMHIEAYRSLEAAPRRG